MVQHGTNVLFLIMIGILLLLSLAVAIPHSLAGSLLILILLAGYVLGFTRKGMQHSLPPLRHIVSVSSAIHFFLMTIAAFTTHTLSFYLDLGPLTASAFLAVVSAAILPKYSAVIFCGAFVGTVEPVLLPTLPMLVLATLFATLLFQGSSNLYTGLGGKLGTIAFCSCLLLSLYSPSFYTNASLPGLPTGLLILLCTIKGAIFTYCLHVRCKQGPIMAAGLIGLSGGLILPALFSASGPLMASSLYLGAFVGMTSPHRLQGETQIGLAAIVAGTLFIFSQPYLGGLGGKLGTLAFASVFSLETLIQGCKDMPLMRHWIPRTESS